MSKKKEKEKTEAPETAAEEKEETAKEETKAEAPRDELREYKVLAGKLEKENKELAAKLEEEKDRSLRVMAEYDNFKKRTAREKDELYFASKADVIKKLLPVFDNLERAESFSSGEECVEGVKLIVRQFREALAALEITEIEAEGKPFDPALHEAVFHDEQEGVPENTVTQVLQKGYQIKDKILRHAMVKVSN